MSNLFNKYKILYPITNNQKFVYKKLNYYSDKIFENAESYSLYVNDHPEYTILAIDVDIKNIPFVKDEFLELFFDDLNIPVYSEESKNGGHHILIKTKKTKEINKQVYKYNNEFLIEILNRTINITNLTDRYSTYDDIFDFLDNAPIVDFNTEEKIRNRIINLCNPYTTKTGKQFDFDKEKTIIKKLNYKLSNLSLEFIFNKLNIDYKESTNYYLTYSLITEDGKHPDVVIYKQDNKKEKYYTALETHLGKVFSLAKYLMYHPEFSGKTENQFIKWLENKLEINFNLINKTNKFNVFVKPNKIYKYDKYIKLEDVKEIIENDKKDIKIIAKTGSGKTTQFIKYFINNLDKKLIMLFPYASQVKQLENYFANNPELNKIDVCFLYEGKFYKKARIIISTYDSAKNKIFELGENLEDYYLIEDEAHTKSEQGFKQKTLKYFQYVENNFKFKKIIYLTGTPEAVYFSDDYIIKFEQNNEKKYKLTHLINDKLKLNVILFNSLLEENNKINIVFLNDKEKSKIIANELKKIKPELKIANLFSEVSGDKMNDFSKKVFNEIIEKQQIETDVDIVFTTSVIQDGININNNNINNIYILGYFSSIAIKQFLARFRKGYKNAFWITKQKINKKKTNYLKLYDTMLNKINKIIETKNNLINNSQKNELNKILDIVDMHTNRLFYVSNIDEIYQKQSPYYYVIYNKIKNKFEIDKFALKKYIYELLVKDFNDANNLSYFFDFNVVYYNGKNKNNNINKITKEKRDKIKEEIKNNLFANFGIVKDVINFAYNSKFLKIEIPESLVVSDYSDFSDYFDKYGKTIISYLKRFIYLYQLNLIDNFNILKEIVFLGNKKYGTIVEKLIMHKNIKYIKEENKFNILNKMDVKKSTLIKIIKYLLNNDVIGKEKKEVIKKLKKEFGNLIKYNELLNLIFEIEEKATRVNYKFIRKYYIKNFLTLDKIVAVIEIKNNLNIYFSITATKN